MSSHGNELLERVYHLLPRAYRYADIDTKYQLKRYLEVLVSGGILPVYDETKGLMTLIDFDKVPAKFLPDLASALGFEFPYDLDEQTQRTFIKNAVISYKIKGTEKALLFMIRELTRFKTWLEVDKETRHIDIYLEVDMERQGFDRITEKAEFLLKEYAPPVKSYQIINIFLWFEEFFANFKDDDYVTVTQYTDLYTDGWFVTNTSELNDEEALLTGEMEYYGREKVGESDETLTLMMTPPEDILEPEFTEENSDTVSLDTVTDTYTITSTHDNEITDLQVDGGLEEYDINGITSQYGYAIINKDEGDEQRTLLTVEEVLEIFLTIDESEISTLSPTETDTSTLHHYNDTEFTYLNVSTQLTTSSNTDIYPASQIAEEFTEKITMV
jgi:phage tail-like protein